jgi:hypothetical protein
VRAPGGCRRVAGARPLLPHLVPASDPATFDSTIAQAIGVDRPPPSQPIALATSYSVLSDLIGPGAFAPRRSVPLAPWLMLAALVPLGLVLGRRGGGMTARRTAASPERSAPRVPAAL